MTQDSSQSGAGDITPPAGTQLPPSAAAYDPAPARVTVPVDTIAVSGPTHLRLFSAEAIGTAVLMILGPGSAILAADAIGAYGVAFAFGLALLAMAYTIGHVSGCHINPAVTLAFWLTRKITTVQAAYYWAAQLVGALIGGLAIYVISDFGDLDKTTNGAGHQIFAANGWGNKIGSPFGIGSAIVVEVLFTALLIFVVLATTTKGYPVGFGGLAAGLTLAVIHLATIPVDNTSVNPARSIGTAIFSGTDALSQLWVFILFPLAGAAVGVGVWLLVHNDRLEDTVLGSHQPLLDVRNRATEAAQRAEDRLS